MGVSPQQLPEILHKLQSSSTSCSAECPELASPWWRTAASCKCATAAAKASLDLAMRPGLHRTGTPDVQAHRATELASSVEQHVRRRAVCVWADTFLPRPPWPPMCTVQRKGEIDHRPAGAWAWLGTASELVNCSSSCSLYLTPTVPLHADRLLCFSLP